MTLRVAFYVQHLLGIGHVMRARRIAEAMQAAGCEMHMIMGGKPVAGLTMPGQEVVQLPAVEAAPGGFKSLVDQHGDPIDEAFQARRRDMLIDRVMRIKPDVVLIEAFPFGRRQMRFELVPLLERLHATAGRPLIACSIRDILQERVKPGRNEESLDWVNRYFDLVLVHGDRTLIQLKDTFPLADRIVPEICYTGIVAPPRPHAAPGSTFDIVVSAGGGAVGRELMTAALAAASDPALSSKQMIVLTGPGLSEADFVALKASAPAQVKVERFIADLPALLAGCALSISQAGYNTVADILLADCRCVLVPFARGGEREQTIRADFLKAQGRAEVVREDELSAQTLARAALAALAQPVPDLQIDAEGAANTAAIVEAHASARAAGNKTASLHAQ